jgi:transcriptional enhancer factor
LHHHAHSNLSKHHQNLASSIPDDIFFGTSLLDSTGAAGGAGSEPWGFIDFSVLPRPKSALAGDGGSSTLAAALDFPISPTALSAGHHGGSRLSASSNFDDGSEAKLLGKRGHTRNGSDGRRHSIQPLISQQSPSRRLEQHPQHHGKEGASASLEDNDHTPMLHSTPGFLLSPPRLTVSLSAPGSESHGSPADTSVTDDGKRRRMSFHQESPTRPFKINSAHGTPGGVTSADDMTLHQLLMQQTPPNHAAWTEMQQRHLTDSVQTVASTVSSSADDSTSFSSAMSRSTSASSAVADTPVRKSNNNSNTGSLVPASTPSKDELASPGQSAEEKERLNAANKQNADVWPDDVEVAFWEGKSAP